jgi:hypothetical protein
MIVHHCSSCPRLQDTLNSTLALFRAAKPCNMQREQGSQRHIAML